ncbi:MAG: BON domain-containing protein [Neisseriaceae bacterium]|jgi:osmotically-inducible protein OsmY
MQKIFNSLVILSLLTSSISSCAVVAVGAVAAAAGTTAAVATDPRKSGTILDDNTIATKLQNKLSNNYPNTNLYVTCYNGIVLLTGQIDSAKSKQGAIFDAKTIPGVRQIYNYLEVKSSQGFSSRTEDSYTTTQIKTKLIGISGVKSNDIKVVTTNSVVYLLGIVTKAQAKEISDAAASINGVTKVVTLFEYTSS